MPRIRSALLALLSLTPLTTLAQEGTILNPSLLPACAFQCGTLTSAQSLCVPPIAPPQGQATYQTCFCNSNFLATYRAGAASPACDDVCTSDADRQAILQWYTGLCVGGVVVIPQGNAPPGNPGTEQIGDETTGVAPGATGTGTVGARPQSSGEHKSWISGHYQWIIMIIILLLAGVGFTLLGIWLKRRHDRRWATGGHPRDSMLRTHDVTSSLGNRHPDPSMMSLSQVYAVAPSSRPGTLSKKGPVMGVRNVS